METNSNGFVDLMQFIKEVKLAQIILDPVGRPRKRNEVCPYHGGQLGFSYTNPVIKSEKNIHYIERFRHYDGPLKDHDIDKKVRFKKPRYANEYNRKLNEAMALSFKPYLKRYSNFNCSPIKSSDINTVLPSCL